jgi:hypothetical protein
MNHENHSGRTYGDILADTREEIKEFVETRITILKAEMSEKLRMLKIVAPLAAVGLLFLFTAFVLFSLALVGVVVAFFLSNPFHWAIAFCAVGVLWTIVGGIVVYFAKREFKPRELMPKRTIGVLKQDKTWIQAEVKSQV